MRLEDFLEVMTGHTYVPHMHGTYMHTCMQAYKHVRARLVRGTYTHVRTCTKAIVRLATMKCVPTDDEVEQGGFDDGGAGQMLLTQCMHSPMCMH